MARLPRLALPGQLHYVLQRGTQGVPLFLDDADHELALDLLQTHAAASGVQVHAYVLMPDSVELLVTPSGEEGVSRFMQGFGRAYVPRFNRRHGRSGTLWGGRYRSGVVQAQRYLLDCMVLMDTRPVQAAMVREAAQYRWSSHAHHVGQRLDRLITPHALYWALGDTPFAREAAYAERVRQGVAPASASDIARLASAGWVLGDAAFVAQLQRQTGRRLSPGKAGRPHRINVSPIN